MQTDLVIKLQHSNHFLVSHPEEFFEHGVSTNCNVHCKFIHVLVVNHHIHVSLNKLRQVSLNDKKTKEILNLFQTTLIVFKRYYPRKLDCLK